MLFIRLISFLLLFIFLQSCSLGDFIVRGIDYYVTKKTASRLGLYTKQENQFQEDLQKLLDKSKPSVKTLNKLITQSKKNNNAQTTIITDKMFIELKSTYKVIFEDITRLYDKYVQMLSDKQFKAFVDDFKERIEKQKKKKTKKEVRKKIISRFEDALGDLTKEQKDYIKKHITPFMAWHEYRLKTNLGIIEAFEAQKTSKKIERKKIVHHKYLTLIKNIHTSLDADYMQECFKHINHVLSMSNKKQRKELNKNIERFQGILKAYLKVNYSD